MRTDQERAERAEYMRQHRAARKAAGYVPTEHEIELRRATQRRYDKKLRETDPESYKEKVSQASKNYRERHPEKAKAATKVWRNNNRDRRNSARRQWNAKNIVHLLYLRAKYRAKGKDIEFTIEESDIPEMGTMCPVFGLPFDISVRDYRETTDNSPSLDRIDPKKGYVPGNVWIITYRANRVKSDATAEEHVLIAAAMHARGV